MYCSVLGFNQEKAIKYNLDMTDLLLLNYIMQANGNPTMKHTINEEISYVWLSHAKLKEDLPILNISEGTLRNRLVELKKKNLITSVVVANNDSRGSMAYYSVTELTIDLTTTSRQNDMVSKEGVPEERPRHFKMTSNNTSKQVDSKTYTNTLSGDKVLDKCGEAAQDSVVGDKQYSREDFLGSARRRKKPITKQSLYSKCLDEIEQYVLAGETDLSLYDVLHSYLDVRLRMTDKPIYGVAQWKAMLVKLDEVAKESGDNKADIVKQSIEHGWASFYPIKRDARKKDVFSEYGQVTCEKSDGKESSGVEF